MIRKNPSQMAMDTHIQKLPQMLTIHWNEKASKNYNLISEVILFSKIHRFFPKH